MVVASVCIFTILFGGFDTLHTPILTIPQNVRFYLITDQVEGEPPPEPYQKILIPDPPFASARQNARYFKLLPPRELWDACDSSIHLDANVQLLKSPLDLVRALSPEASLGLVRHPFLNHYQAEISHLCQVYPRDCSSYEHTRDGFVAKGFHPLSPQYETSFIIRKHTDQVRDLMERWKNELFSSGHLRDQVVLAPVLYLFQKDLTRYQNDHPFTIQLYKGHNEDFAKWQCHTNVMGQRRSGFTHAVYCLLYYGIKRYTPWVERLAPVTFGMIATLKLQHPRRAGMVFGMFTLLATSLWLPQWRRRLTRSTPLHRRVKLSLQFAVVVAIVLGIMLASFYTIPMAISVLWPCVLLFTPIAYIMMPVYTIKDVALVHYKKDDHESLV